MPFVYRHRPWWLVVTVVGSAVLAVGLVVWQISAGFGLYALSWVGCLAIGAWLYSRVWSYEVTVDDDVITVRGLLRQRARPLSELTGVHYFGSGVALRFGRRIERVLRRGDSASGLVDELRERVPHLPQSLAAPPWRWRRRAAA